MIRTVDDLIDLVKRLREEGLAAFNLEADGVKLAGSFNLLPMTGPPVQGQELTPAVPEDDLLDRAFQVEYEP